MYFVKEQKSRSEYPDEQAAYERLATAWNRVHRTLMFQSPETITTAVGGNSFFISGGYCVAIEGDGTPCSGLDNARVNRAVSFDVIEGQSADDLNELATAMEQWLERPSFIQMPTGTLTNTPERAALLKEFSDQIAPHFEPDFRPDLTTG